VDDTARPQRDLVAGEVGVPVLLIQDNHIVIGREEVPFDDTYRSELAPRIAEDPGTRLAGFFWAPHGGGEGYEAVTLTAVADTAALDRHQQRLATGDLAELWGGLEAKQRSIESSLNIVTEWSPIADTADDRFEVADHATTMFRLDSYRVPGAVSDAVASVESQWRGRAQDDAVGLVACWSRHLGELDEPIVSVLSRVASDDSMRASFAAPFDTWTGVPRLSGARRITRLLRCSTWSPIH
jgi:hypothetical protein